MAHGPVDEPIRSAYADDPEMIELVELFVAEMPEKVRELETLWSSGDGTGLERVAHQLKGASAGYGYGVLTSAARELELALKDDGAEADLEAVRAQFEELIDLCSRVSL